MQGSVKREIVDYFDETLRYYQTFWHGPTGALHFGIRAPGVRGHLNELRHTNEVLASAAEIACGERVLDAGCGTGGSSVWLAQQRHARVVGITLSAVQAATASQRAKEAGVSSRVSFALGDFCNTPLESGSFDAVWALESSCYAEKKEPLFDECFRLLRDGGRLVVSDGFLRREPRGSIETALYAAFKRGLVLPDLPSLASFIAALEGCGFVDVHAESRIADVGPSCRRLFWRCLLSYPLALLAAQTGRVSERLLANSRAGIATYPLAQLGVADYAVVVARKPELPP